MLVDREAECLSGNLERLGSPAEVRVVEKGVEEAVRSLRVKGERFDIVFSDPPYGRSDPIPGELSSLLRRAGSSCSNSTGECRRRSLRI